MFLVLDVNRKRTAFRFTLEKIGATSYMKRITAVVALTLVLFSALTSVRADEKQELESKIREIGSQFAPDSRLELFNVVIDEGKARVETTSADAKNAVLALAADFPQWEIVALKFPEENPELDGKWRAIVNYSTIQLQQGPDFATEWSTQSLMGTPVKILKKTPSYWILIQNYDGYIGYTTKGSVHPLTEDEFAKWRDAKRLIWLANFGSIYSEPSDDSATISDLVAGDVVVWKNEETQNGFYRVETPDGRLGWIPVKDSMEWSEWTTSRELTSENLISAARRLLGHPYVWGGTSAKGVDCSGLVNFAFMFNGYNILRDVSQIRREGIDVDMSQGWKGYQPGDLLIFGQRREGREWRWRHVGIYIGDGRFIHSATVVHENSLDPDSPDYDPGNAKELIKVVRMIGAPETEHYHPISKNAFFGM